MHILERISTDIRTYFRCRELVGNKLTVIRYISSVITWIQEWWRTNSYVHFLRTRITHCLNKISDCSTTNDRVINQHYSFILYYTRNEIKFHMNRRYSLFL